MAEKISQMDPAAPLAGTEQVEVSQDISGTLRSRRLALTDLKDWLEKKNNLSASTDPGPNDDSSAGYQVGSKWKNGQEWWICSAATEGAAHWEPTTLSADELGTAALAEVGQFLQVANNGNDIADPAAFRAALDLLGMALQADAASDGQGYERRDGGWSPAPIQDREMLGPAIGSIILSLRKANPNGGPVFRISDESDPSGFWSIEDGTSASGFVPIFRGKTADPDRPGLNLTGDSAGTDTGTRPLVLADGRIDNGFVTARPLFGVANRYDIKLTVQADGGTYCEAEVISSAYVRGGVFTVATLPSSPHEGALAHASDGLKSGETTGNGTGVPVYFSNGSWRVQGADTPVQA